MEQNNETPNIEFQEEKSEQSSQYLQPQTPKIIQWFIKYSGGLIKDEKQANYVIWGLIGLFSVITIILFYSALSGPSKPPAGYRGNIPDLPEYRNPPTP